MYSKKVTKILPYSLMLLAAVMISLVAFFAYFGLAYPDYSGRYQADCDEPSCSFELHGITSKEYLMKYLGEEVKMRRFVGPANKIYLLNTAALIATPPFPIASIWLYSLSSGHTKWQGRTYYKMVASPDITTDH